jgi:hypothetical protein
MFYNTFQNDINYVRKLNIGFYLADLIFDFKYLRKKLLFAEKSKAANISESGLEYGSSTWARTRDTRINSCLANNFKYIDLYQIID